MVIAVALCLGATGCNSDDGGPDTDGSTANLDQRARPTEKSVRAFYARASKAYRTGDAKQLCSMMQPRYANAMVKQAAASGADVSTCPETWRLVFSVDPDGYKDKISKVDVKGKTATFLSGDDPWRLRFVHGEWRIVGG